MKRCLSLILLLFASIALAVSAACSDPADVVAIGELCLPDRADCSAAEELWRPSVGRNSLEFSLRSELDEGSFSTSVVRITTAEDISLPDTRPRSDEGDTILFEGDYPLTGGEIVRERLNSYYLTVAKDLRIELECAEGDCDSRLEYTYFSDAIECVDDGVCGRNEFCEQSYGRCAECGDDTHCDGTQSCDRETGHCFPGGSTGCHTTSGTAKPAIPLLCLFVLFGLMLWRKSYRRFPRSGHGRRKLGSVLILFCGLSLIPASPAHAGTSASMNLGGGMRTLTGEVGDLTHPGWGIAINHQLRWGRYASTFQISTNSFGLRDAAGADRERISGYGISLGPRVYLSLPVATPTLTGDDYPFEVFAGLDYTRWSVAENRLANITGLDLNYHAVGPSAGIVWKWRSLELTGRGHYAQIFDWPGGLFSLDITVGIAP